MLYKKKSRDHGTLGHLFSLLGRLPHANDPKKDLHACLDVLITIVKGHIIAAACNELGLRDMDGTLSLASQLQLGNEAKNRSFIMDLAIKIVDDYLWMPNAMLNQSISESCDGVYNYTRILCHCGSLVMEFTNAGKYGDGKRIRGCWKFFLLHFYKEGRTKYALESLLLQFQLYSLPPTLAHQVQWERFINTKGGMGNNISCDLHNEHVNRIFKEAIGNMGSNFTEHSTTRVARSVTFLDNLANNLDKQCSVVPDTTAHHTRSSDHDIRQVCNTLCKQQSFTVIPGRYHSNFKSLSTNPLKSLDWNKMEKWVKAKALQYEKRSGLMREGNVSDEEATDIESDATDDEL